MLGDALANFHLLRPWWLAGLLPAAALWWQMRQAGDGRSRWLDVIDPALASYLLVGEHRHQRPWPLLLLALAWLLVCVALAGPTWQRLEQPVHQRADGLVILLDLSLSMYARDVAPSRIHRARFEVEDILNTRQDGLTGLIAYAGDAHTVTPLTDDTRTISNLLPSLEPSIMPIPGSNLEPALHLAHRLLKSSGIEAGRVLLITDEINNLADVSAVVNDNYPLSILGIGTDAGGPIPLDFANQPGALLKDDQGITVLPRLDREQLQQAARIGGGRFRVATADTNDIEALLATPLLRTQDLREKTNTVFDAWQDQGYWLALALLPLLWLSFRRGVVACIPLATLIAIGCGSLLLTAGAGPALAEEATDGAAARWQWQDLWQRRDQQAMSALKRGEPEVAAAMFEAPDWRGTAFYRSDKFEQAGALFGQQQDARSHYNRGNALARLGRFDDAISAYERALALAPDHDDAKHNRDLLERLKNQQQGESDNENQQDSGGEEDQQQRSEGSSSDSDPSGDEQPSDQSPESGDDGSATDEDAQAAQQQEGQEASGTEADEAQSDATAEAPTLDDEESAAMAQWLRRVPDEPGGLLKEKFRRQSRDRFIERAQRRRSGERIW